VVISAQLTAEVPARMATVSASTGIGRDATIASPPQLSSMPPTRSRSLAGTQRASNGPPRRPT